MKLLTVLCALSLLSSGLTAAEKTLDIYFIDVEGGQATLIVTPEKQSILVDTGWPGFEDRDADRIAKMIPHELGITLAGEDKMNKATG